MKTLHGCLLFALGILCALDCLTTIIGYSLGALEANPIMGSILNISTLGFIAVKLSGTTVIYLGFTFTRKTLTQASQFQPNSLPVKATRYLWAGLLYLLLIVMTFVLVNNIDNLLIFPE